MAKEREELLPKKSIRPRASSEPSRTAARFVLAVRAFGVLAGGFVTLVAVMSLVGLVTDNLWARLIVGLLVVIGLPAFLADRLLKRADGGDQRAGLGLVADVFAIVLLGIALVVVAADALTRPMLAREGDRYARGGSTILARALYFVAGVSPVFPGEARARAGKGAAAGSASADAGGPDAGGARQEGREGTEGTEGTEGK